MRKLIDWLTCLLFGHDWKKAGVGLPDSAMAGEEYHQCVRCEADSRPTWLIQDDTECRLERLHHQILER